MSLSRLFVNFAVPVPASIESLTFNAVRPISINGSTEIKTPASATGKFNVDNTIMDANVAPPPTPATPNQLIITTPMTDNINCKLTSTPAAGATIIANIAG